MSRPYLKIARKYFESDEWTTPRTFSEQEAWLDMIYLACYASHDIDLGKDGLLTLERGEFYYTQRQLSQRWGWALSKVNRFLARLAEGSNPRIEKIQRETHFETQSETQVETQITIVRLCNYNTYNRSDIKLETHFETQNETQSETLKNKGIKNKGIKNTHTHFTCLLDLFVQACWRAHESAEACSEACKTAEEILLYCGQDEEARKQLVAHRKADNLFGVMLDLYRYYHTLQSSFRKPLHPQQMQDLLRTYDIADIWRIMEAIDNKREQVKSVSLYQTIKSWLATDIVLANKRREQQKYN